MWHVTTQATDGSGEYKTALVQDGLNEGLKASIKDYLRRTGEDLIRVVDVMTKKDVTVESI